jgi:hypothetical protein
LRNFENKFHLGLNTGIIKDIQDMVIFSELESIPTISCKLDII